jgi:hypothetical protein
MYTQPRRLLLILAALAAVAGWTFSSNLAGPVHALPGAQASEPIWGRKPVLSYFLLTPTLAAELQAEVGLSAGQFAALQEAARGEVSRLQEIDRHSLEGSLPTQEFGLTYPARGQTAAEAAAYNRQVLSAVQASAGAASEILGPEKFNRLVDWINTRWEVERRLHGIASATGKRSYEVYATRFDSGGSYTVALPDKCLKIANNGSHLCDDSGYAVGQAYEVKIDYQSSARVTVGESGPWNVDDNFWAGVGDPQPRRMFIDLPRGMSAAQAAYFDDYNNGRDQFGRMVTSPVAIDLAREVSVDIGLQPGTNDWVTVTFLWTEGWSETGATVVTLNEPSRLRPAYAGDMCGSAWHKIEGYGGRPAFLTLNAAASGESTNQGEWYPDLPQAGRYRVQAFIPDHPPIEWQCPSLSVPRDTARARYRILHAGGETSVTGNQGPLANLWLDLGEYTFEAGAGGGVELADLTGEESLSRTVAFSAVRFVSLEEPAPTPLPSPTATPRPPDPVVWSSSLSALPGSSAAVALRGSHIPPPGLAELSLELRYDPGLLTLTGCQADPGGQFATEDCQLDYERDGIAPDSLRLQLSAPGGLSGEALLAQVVFQVADSPGQSTTLEVVPQLMTAPGGLPLALSPRDGILCIRPCGNIQFLPWLLQLFGFE